MKIFYDPLGGDRFGVVWDPTLTQPRAFRVLNHFSSTPVAKVRPSSRQMNLSLCVLTQAAGE
jgi:U3 small nucleolar RNA-associated protein 22